jgi:hypothetical protein
MPFYTLFGKECHGQSIGQLFDGILFNSDNFLATMCSSNSSRDYSPTFPTNIKHPISTISIVDADLRPPTTNSGPAKSRPQSLSVETSTNPSELHTLDLKVPRKLVKSPISVTSSSPNSHMIPPPNNGRPPPRISCSRNIDLRRKSLSERHFFRPVSHDEESSTGTKQT